MDGFGQASAGRQQQASGSGLTLIAVQLAGVARQQLRAAPRHALRIPQPQVPCLMRVGEDKSTSDWGDVGAAEQEAAVAAAAGLAAPALGLACWRSMGPQPLS